MLAGLTLLDAARQAGVSYHHVVAICGGREQMTDTDRRDLAALLGCPAHWLARGWQDDGAWSQQRGRGRSPYRANRGRWVD
jgi:hypothetical protein